MLAKKFSHQESPTRPLNPRPKPLFEAVSPRRAQLALVREPLLSARGLAWLHRKERASFDAEALHAILQLEKLNLG
ncbi:MAG TPA: hypothetical protein VGI10_07945 [Polyangiaceae bacterium]|jgi:hypothetical protein